MMKPYKLFLLAALLIVSVLGFEVSRLLSSALFLYLSLSVVVAVVCYWFFVFSKAACSKRTQALASFSLVALVAAYLSASFSGPGPQAQAKGALNCNAPLTSALAWILGSVGAELESPVTDLKDLCYSTRVKQKLSHLSYSDGRSYFDLVVKELFSERRFGTGLTIMLTFAWTETVKKEKLKQRSDFDPYLEEAQGLVAVLEAVTMNQERLLLPRDQGLSSFFRQLNRIAVLQVLEQTSKHLMQSGKGRALSVEGSSGVGSLRARVASICAAWGCDATTLEKERSELDKMISSLRTQSH